MAPSLYTESRHNIMPLAWFLLFCVGTAFAMTFCGSAVSTLTACDKLQLYCDLAGIRGEVDLVRRCDIIRYQEVAARPDPICSELLQALKEADRPTPGPDRDGG